MKVCYIYKPKITEEQMQSWRSWLKREGIKATVRKGSPKGSLRNWIMITCSDFLDAQKICNYGKSIGYEHFETRLFTNDDNPNAIKISYRVDFRYFEVFR